MNFKHNHFLHFIITLFVMIFITIGLGLYQGKLMKETRDANRLASAKLLLIAIENYQANFDAYPSDLSEVEPFLSPIPVDPLSGKVFLYQKKDEGFELIVPQEKGEDIIFRN